MAEQKSAKAGIGCWGFGSVLAMVIGWSQHGSIFWTIVDGLLSWIYVVWFALSRAP